MDQITAPDVTLDADVLIEEIRTLKLGQLEERVANLQRIPRLPDGSPGARPCDCEAVIEALRQYLKIRINRRRFQRGDRTTLQRVQDLLAKAADSDISAYPETRLSLTLLRVEIMILVGQAREALAIVGPMAEHLHALEGSARVLERVYLLDARARLELGDIAQLTQVAFGRFAMLARWRKLHTPRLFLKWQGALAAGPIRRPGGSAAEFIIRLCARAMLTQRGGAAWRIDRVTSWGVMLCLGTLFATLTMWLLPPRRRVPQGQLTTPPLAGIDRRDVLVSRVVDNPGDIVMLLPGLTALAQKLGRPVWLATRPEFAPLLHDNPHVRLLDATAPLGVTAFRKWFNFSACPADAYETRMRPHVRQGRVILFARALGISARRLRESGLVPLLRLSTAQLALRSRLRAGAALVVGVAPFARDPSRAVPQLAGALDALTNGLAAGTRVVLLDSGAQPAPAPQAGVHLPLRRMALADAIAAIAACDYLVAVDDWVLTLAAALHIPTLALAGPTLSARLMPHHPKLKLLEPPEHLPCRPCWRSQSQPCGLTGLRRSACLSAVSVPAIGAALQHLMTAYPVTHVWPGEAGCDAAPLDAIATMPCPTQAGLAAFGIAEASGRAAAEEGNRPTRVVREALRYQEFEVVAERIESLLRAPRSLAGFTVLRPRDCRLVTEQLRRLLDAERQMLEMGSTAMAERILSLADRLALSDITDYPNEVLHLDILRADVLIALGREAAALALLDPIAMRPALVEGDMTTLAWIFGLESRARLSLGELSRTSRVALARVHLMAKVRPLNLVRRLKDLDHAMAVGGSTGGAVSITDALLRLGARVRLRSNLINPLNPRRPVRHMAFQIVSFAIDIAGRIVVMLSALDRNPRLPPDPDSDQPEPAPAPARAPGPVLVTRAMGGLGDVMMMTPGLAALASRSGRPVHFATRRQFFPMLANNPTIELLDIEQPLDPARYQRWINLSFCPAAGYESLVVPRVRRSRVELFARRMGITPRRLAKAGWTPRCHLSPAQVTVRDEARARHGAAGLPIIGVQPYARELYRAYPQIASVLALLADEAVLIVFHTSLLPLPAHQNIVQLPGSKLADSIATLAACDYFLGVDSAFFHIAGAFGIPALGVFGPTSARMRSVGYRQVRLVQPAENFPCMPCWRNEDQPCHLSGGTGSACLESLAPLTVATEVRRLIADHPRPAPSITPAGA